MAKDSPPISLDDSLLEHPAFQWISDNGRKIGYGALFLLLALILLYRLFAASAVQTERDYLNLEGALSNLSNPEKQDATLTEIDKLLTKHPELKPKYDGVIAQILLSENELPKALPYIERTFQRVNGETPPLFIDYAKTSLLIADGKLENARNQALKLKEEILANLKDHPSSSFGGVLYAFNLIRIALLEKELKNKDAAQKAFGELKDLAKQGSPVPISQQDLQRVMTHFDDEGAKLKDYLN